jgi:hypothetical protein
MTKRRIDRELDDLSDELLVELTPNERMQLMLKARAKGKDTWIERLEETAPRYSYQATDLAYVERIELAKRYLQHAVYDLHTTLLHYKHLNTIQTSRWVIDSLREDSPTDEHLEQAGERADELKWLFGEVYTLYHAYRQFATEIFGLDIDTWFALHPDGEAVLAAVRELLEEEEFQQELAAELLNFELHGEELDPSDSEWLSLETLAEQRYEAYVALWEDAVAEIPG